MLEHTQNPGIVAYVMMMLIRNVVKLSEEYRLYAFAPSLNRKEKKKFPSVLVDTTFSNWMNAFYKGEKKSDRKKSL